LAETVVEAVTAAVVVEGAFAVAEKNQGMIVAVAVAEHSDA
jgi:hypothetical protein